MAGKASTYAYLIVDDNRNRDNTGRNEPGDRIAYDEGYYEYYAGASYLRNTNGKCVRFGGSVLARRRRQLRLRLGALQLSRWRKRSNDF